MTVRSKRLAIHTVAIADPAETLLYTCPANVTAIVKSASVANAGPGADSVGIIVKKGGVGGTFGHVLFQNNLRPLNFVEVLGSFFVLEPTDALFFELLAPSTAQYDILIGGAELSGTAP